MSCEQSFYFLIPKCTTGFPNKKLHKKSILKHKLQQFASEFSLCSLKKSNSIIKIFAFQK